MSDNENSRLIFNSKEYELPDQFAKSNNISRDIYRKLNRNEYKYEVQSKVDDENFQIFFEYLVDGKEPEIHLDNIYELKQLAKEFQISELIEKINEKFKKWREIEKTLDQQSTSSNVESLQPADITQAIQQIYQIFDKMKDQIEKLEKRVISIESQNKTLESQFKNDMETYFDQQIEQIKESNENKENEIYSNLQQIKDEIESKNDQFENQKLVNVEYSNLFERLQNQLELLSSEIPKQNDKLSEFESDVNVQLEAIKQTCLTKEVFNFIYLSNFTLFFFI